MKCNLIHCHSGHVTVTTVADPVCTTTVLDACAMCQLPYGQYTVEHPGATFNVTFTQADQESYNMKVQETYRAQ